MAAGRRCGPGRPAVGVKRSGIGRSGGDLERAGPRRCAGRTFAQDDHAQHLVLGHVARAGRAHHLAVLHHADTVGQVEDIVDVVTDEKDAYPIGLELLYGERPETTTESRTVQEGGDVSVLGKVKRRF